jgi:hypothetical protein
MALVRDRHSAEEHCQSLLAGYARTIANKTGRANSLNMVEPRKSDEMHS